jgi:hypothetical protein
VNKESNHGTNTPLFISIWEREINSKPGLHFRLERIFAIHESRPVS